MAEKRHRMWTRQQCVAMRRCPDCEMHLVKQGHATDCPHYKEPAK